MPFVQRPGRPPTSPVHHDPISAAIGVASLIESFAATTIGGAITTAVIGVAASRGISMVIKHVAD